MTESKICTCPSGDGSLRWPCPAHPAVEQAGGDERAEFERAFTVQEGVYFDDKRGEYRSMNLRAIEATDAQDLNLRLQGWQARAALAQPSPKREQRLVECDACPTSGGCVEKCMKAPTQPSPAQAEAERPEVAEVAFVLRNIGAMDAEDIDGDNVDLRFEDAEGRDTGCDVSIVEYAEKAADLFEQHDRIVGALRAENAKLSEALDECDGDRWKLRSERDAANARLHEVATACATAEQERDAALARVAELERQEPVATVAKVPGEDWNSLDFHRDLQDMQPGTKLYAAPVAQAQQLHDLDKQCRDDVARALGLRPNQERGFAWSYLLASIKSCVKASGDSAQAQHSVPESVRAWFEAKQAHVNAVDAYNARLKFVREHCPFGTSVDPEYQLMEEADRLARGLVGPMFDELRSLLAAAPGKEGV
ncbi:TPA: hypothetical protein L4I40_002144 [Pseudomonas aeruginosa]|nr:hypothetical protein [Pseudomonas aeruginosa]